LFQVVPEDASKLADFQKIIESTSQFETALKEIMFISASDNKDERLRFTLHLGKRQKSWQRLENCFYNATLTSLK